MALWPDEYEDLRDEARAIAKAIADMTASSGSAEGLDRDQRVARMRELANMAAVASPDGSDEQIGGVPCRVFRPSEPARGVYLDAHGSGMIAASAMLNDSTNARRAEQLNLAVVSVDYRLAPEHPYPAAPDDCFAVARWLLEHSASEFGTSRLVIGGDSAGATLSVLTLLRVRDELGASDAFCGANLEYGAYDFGGTPSARGAGPGDVQDTLDPGLHDLVNSCYLPGRSLEERQVPEISPLYARLHDLPPALFTVGSADRLVDDSFFMSARWEQFGNQAELAVYPDCVHAFPRFPMELANRANERIDGFIERVLA